MNDRKKIEKIATDRGWKVLRRGAHEQLIMTYPPSGARFSIGSTPRSMPSTNQLTRKMVGLERSSRARMIEEVLDWWCEQEGIPEDGSLKVKRNITQLTVDFCEAKGYTFDKIESIKGGLAASDRLWYIERARRGLGAETNPPERLLFGRKHIMTVPERELVLQFQQTNGLAPRRSEITALQREAAEIVKARNDAEEEGRKLAQSERVAKVVERLYDSGPDPFPKDPIHPTWDEQRAADREIGAPEGSGPPPAAFPATNGNGHLPDELVAALRAWAGADTSETDTAIQMASEALDAAQNAIEAAREALALAVAVKG